jgi:hypothetical protein
MAHQTSPDRVGMVFVPAHRGQAPLWEALAGLPHSRALLRTETEFLEWITGIENGKNEKDSCQALLMILDDETLWASRVSQAAVNRLEAVVRRGEVLGFTLAASLPAPASSGTDGVARILKTARVGLWLRPTDASEASSVGLRLPHTPNVKLYPPGRGYLYQPGSHQLVQIASPFIDADGCELPRPGQLDAWVKRIQQRWGEQNSHTRSVDAAVSRGEDCRIRLP